MKEIIFRVYGIPQTQPKENNFKGRVYHRDNPILLRHYQTGELVRFNEQIIDWPHGLTPRTRASKDGRNYEHIQPRLFWSRLILSVAFDHCQPGYFGRDPLMYGALFFLPRPKAVKLSDRPFPTNSDLDNYNYVVWNTLKAQLFHDDDQIQWVRAGGKVWADDDNPPGAIIWIKQIEGVTMHKITGDIAHYKAKLRFMKGARV